MFQSEGENSVLIRSLLDFFCFPFITESLSEEDDVVWGDSWESLREYCRDLIRGGWGGRALEGWYGSDLGVGTTEGFLLDSSDGLASLICHWISNLSLTLLFLFSPLPWDTDLDKDFLPEKYLLVAANALKDHRFLSFFWSNVDHYLKNISFDETSLSHQPCFPRKEE